jgi:hypothetical protein
LSILIVSTEEAITGDALIALLHSDLKEMSINSIGHRLTILKGVYDMKVKQNISMEAEHYIPLCSSCRIPLAATAMLTYPQPPNQNPKTQHRHRTTSPE